MNNDEVQIPHNFTARDYQIPALREIEKAIKGKSEKRYFYLIWHRRSGKDKSCIADPIPRRLIRSPVLIKYVYPTLVMGRDNMWDGIGKDGFRYINHIPENIRTSQPNNTRMSIRVRNNTDTSSIFQIAGTNKPDTLRGGNPEMFIFSEWADHDPYAWDVAEPILRENNGIAIFNTTPKGDNHARALMEAFKNHPKWFIQTLTVDDTGIFTRQQMEDIRNDVIRRFEANGRSKEEAEAYIMQEYYCSFDAPVIGSYYGAALIKAERENRITTVPYNQAFPVHTAWDLGMDDSTTIWFYQEIGSQILFIDYYENSGEGLNHYIQYCKDKPYIYGNHYAPHDIEVRELGTGKSRYEVAKSLGLVFKPVNKMSIDDGINAVRTMLSRCYFDDQKCNRGIMALKNYKKDWDEKNMVFRNYPLHNWASHGADALRTKATAKDYVAPYRPQSQGGVNPYPEEQ